MKTYLAVLILALSGVALSQKCNLQSRHQDVEFPNIEERGGIAFQMSVEYTIVNAKQTDFFTEYYHITDKKGRVDSHQGGENIQYIYYAETGEAWNIQGRECSLQNVTDIPRFHKHAPKDWMYMPSEMENWTNGPSAMFKIAYDKWNTSKREDIAYMGPYPGLIRGVEAVFWRWCKRDDYEVNYYFTAPDVENTYFDWLKYVPLRVHFRGKDVGETDLFQEQYFDILKFQPYINNQDEVFQLPKGRNCRRGDLVKKPELPDFKETNIFFSSEVIYRQINMDDWQDNSSYYSTILLARDLESNHISYYYTPWDNGTDADSQEETSPVRVVYDMTHKYQYVMDIKTDKCTIQRARDFYPYYELPDHTGKISLTDPYVLFPSNEIEFLQEAKARSMRVNEYEGYQEDYVIEKGNEYVKVPKAYITHSYLTDNEIIDNTAGVKNALVQIQHRYTGRKPNMLELLTFNLYGFTTSMEHRSLIFDVSKCYKNDDDYLWVVIGFDVAKDDFPIVARMIPMIRFDVMKYLEHTTELNPLRIPFMMANLRQDGLDVIMLVLGKPPLELDFTERVNKTTIADPALTQGASVFEACATKCLEELGSCWGFAMCGNVCLFPKNSSVPAPGGDDCTLYRRFTNDTYMPSKENQANILKRTVEVGEMKLSFSYTDRATGDRKLMTLPATSAQVLTPGEDDSLFQQLGNIVDSRMRVSKTGYKLKKGTAIKNLGVLRYDECQKLCLDFKNCETVSYCLKTSECIISSKFDVDIPDTEKVADNTCNLLARKYSDNFKRSPGIYLSQTAFLVMPNLNLEDCARACLTQKGFQCLSFDHCPQAKGEECRMHKVHYLSPSELEKVRAKNSTCGHYHRKYSTEFKRAPNSKIIGSTVAPIYNVTLEECSKSCVDFNKGTCYGFDYCQDRLMYSTSCAIIDIDPSRLKKAYSPICTSYKRDSGAYAPRPYSNGYAGGIGFLCFLIGGLVGVGVVFGIAYFKVNRR